MFKMLKRSLHECFNKMKQMLLFFLLFPPLVTLLSIVAHRFGLFSASGILSSTELSPLMIVFFSATFLYTPFTRYATIAPLAIVTPVPFYIPIFARFLFSLPISFVVIVSRIALYYAFRGEPDVSENHLIHWLMKLSLFVFSYSLIILLITVKSIFRYKFNFDRFVNLADKITEDNPAFLSLELLPFITAASIIQIISSIMFREGPPIPWPAFFVVIIPLSIILCFIASNILEKHSNY
jgi:hypothetical protein